MISARARLIRSFGIRPMRYVMLCLILVVSAGCVTQYAALNEYAKVQNQFVMGMSRNDFYTLAAPVIQNTTSDARRDSQFYVDEGRKFEIVYLRSGWISDGASTDDEYTPFIFVDDVPVAKGWKTLGGMRVTSTDIKKAEAGATKIDIEQNNNGSGGNKYFKPYCPPSKYPIYGCD